MHLLVDSHVEDLDAYHQGKVVESNADKSCVSVVVQRLIARPVYLGRYQLSHPSVSCGEVVSSQLLTLIPITLAA